MTQRSLTAIIIHCYEKKSDIFQKTEHFATDHRGSSSSYKKEKQNHSIKQTAAKKNRKTSEEKYKKRK